MNTFPSITMASNGYWYATVPNVASRKCYVSTEDGIKTQVPKVLEFCGNEKIVVINKLLDYFHSIK
jgi:hypothetical protein